MIEIDHLTKRYSRHTAVDDISFSVGLGEVVGFLGPNGAGKTTTLRMLTGYLPPSSGFASVDGHDVFRAPLAARRKIGYLPESVPLYLDMRVREYLTFRGQIKGLRSRDLKRRLDEVLDQCGLQSVRRKMIKTLSKGFRQRVGIADALIHDPPLLILDEPTNGLDPNQIRAIRKLIKSLGEKHTILVSTHILSEVAMLCNKIIIIDNGRIKAADSPTNLVGQMRAAGRISAELKGPSGDIGKALGNIAGVKKVTHELSKDAWEHFSIFVESGTDAREHIANLAQKHLWPLRSLFRHEATLEEVFVELTRKD
ncbi:MAG: ATP-binding cassette domain-containing protein [Verrucomicrobia bacterium]|nr:ATP-binding cassette domain-containing protein [Verrucomicrobiota bacterium]MDA1006232.1 ATP-binding cassette domain-containing protein [Verrucomicrobiota bacterium]